MSIFFACFAIFAVKCFWFLDSDFRARSSYAGFTLRRFKSEAAKVAKESRKGREEHLQFADSDSYGLRITSSGPDGS